MIHNLLVLEKKLDSCKKKQLLSYMYMFSGSEHSIDLIREGSRRSFKPVLSYEEVFQMRGIG